jgi:hypothetical protein
MMRFLKMTGNTVRGWLFWAGAVLVWIAGARGDAQSPEVELAAISRAIGSAQASLQQIAVHYRIEITQVMPQQEIARRIEEEKRRFNIHDPAQAAPLPRRMDCLWAATNGKEYFETIAYDYQVREKRLVLPDKTILWAAPHLGTNDKPLPAIVVITPEKEAGGMAGLRFARFCFEDDQGESLSQSFSKGQWHLKATEVIEDGYFHVLRRGESPGLGVYREIWLDANRNFAPARAVILSNGKPVNDWRVLEFRSVLSDLWIPQAIRMEKFWHDSGELLHIWSITVEDVKVNEAVPPDQFEIRWERGTLVIDKITGKKYREGESAPLPLKQY